jgi:hypothetical protein
MVDANVVSMKLAEILDRMARVREVCPTEPQELAADAPHSPTR